VTLRLRTLFSMGMLGVVLLVVLVGCGGGGGY
jgi:hypothetical protein